MDLKKFKEFNDYRLNNPVEYYERLMGIKLLPYQKLLLRMLSLKEEIRNKRMGNIRSKRHKQIINICDIPVQLIRKEDDTILKPLYLNCYSKVYYFTKDDNVIFIEDKALKKYKIERLEDY